MNTTKELFNLYESYLGIYEQEVEEGFVPLDDRKRALVTRFINKGIDKLERNADKLDVVKRELANKQIPSHPVGKLVKDTTKTSKLVGNAQQARERSTQERIAVLRRQLDLVTPKNNIRRLPRGFQKNDVEYVLDYLIDEGFAINYDAAFGIFESMSDEWLVDIFEATPAREATVRGRVRVPGAAQRATARQDREAAARERAAKRQRQREEEQKYVETRRQNPEILRQEAQQRTLPTRMERAAQRLGL